MSAPEFGYRSVVVRRGGAALRWSLRSVVVCSVLAAATFAVTVWALMRGDYALTPGEVWSALIGDPEAGFARTVVVEWRLPRALAAVVFGAALGVSGAVFQSMIGNPLASPDVIGFSAGAYTGAIVVLVVLGGSYLQLAGGAFAGGMATAVVVYVVAWKHGVQGFRLIIVGIAVSAMLASVNTWLLLNADLKVAIRAGVWGTGSLDGTGWEQLGWAAAAAAVLLVAVAACGPSLRQLELGDDAAAATGVRVESVRRTAMVLGVALTAVVTAAAGPIAFVALAAPQVARRAARTPGVTLAPAAFAGAFLLALADLVAQHLLFVSMPTGVVTVVAGGMFLIWLVVVEARCRG
ncbi:MAG: iron chelate uptake ABC transporter family permease subunit [Aeromicrobium sp.]|uniref:FecCD family ABC transporter permease n=1 Tax=Aeromicrobium sp. TaxID=1871063 RepID=UPI0039E2FD6F